MESAPATGSRLLVRGPLLAAMLVTVAGCPASCGFEECIEKVSVIDNAAWQLLAAADDPFLPPADAPLCTLEDVHMEPFGAGGELSLDVDTGRGCGWATLQEPTLVDLAPADEVQVRVFYFSQLSFPEAVAEIALAVDGERMWSVEVPIPASSTLEAPRFTVGDALSRDTVVPAGTPLQFHIGNHGDNTWNLLELSRLRKGPCR